MLEGKIVMMQLPIFSFLISQERRIYFDDIYPLTKIIPGEDEVNKYEALYLNRLLITQAPAIALGNAKKELVHLASYTIQSLEDSYAFFDKGDEKYFDKVEKYETAVNSIDEELTTYLIEISNELLSVYENEILASVRFCS